MPGLAGGSGLALAAGEARRTGRNAQEKAPARSQMTAPASPRPLRLLHVHDSFAAGADELRRVALINRFGAAVSHMIVSAIPGATAAIRHISRGIRVEQAQ